MIQRWKGWKWAIGVAALACGGFGPSAQAGEIPSVVVAPLSAGERIAYDGVVEPIRQTVVGAQVAGAVIGVEVKVGDRVRAGQTLARIDSRAADQNVAASDAQVQAARASLEVATKEVERQRALHAKRYISDAALDRAESQFKATQAQVNAQLAQAAGARTQSGFFVVRAPYAGIVSEVPITLGDMAMPGRPLVTLYDPSALRVAVSVPQSAMTRAPAPTDVEVELPGTAPGRLAPVRVTVLPTIDAASHTVIVRLDLPGAMTGIAPGMFARAHWVSPRETTSDRIAVPTRAIVQRAELSAVYVLDPNGNPLLRMVRLGRRSGDQVEILAGLARGERVVTEPHAAMRPPPVATAK